MNHFQLIISQARKHITISFPCGRLCSLGYYRLDYKFTTPHAQVNLTNRKSKPAQRALLGNGSGLDCLDRVVDGRNPVIVLCIRCKPVICVPTGKMCLQGRYRFYRPELFGTRPERAEQRIHGPASSYGQSCSSQLDPSSPSRKRRDIYLKKSGLA